MRVTCGPSGPSEFDLDSKSVEFVVFVVEFGWSLLVWGSTKQLQRWSSVEVPFTHPEEPLCDSEHKYNFDCDLESKSLQDLSKLFVRQQNKNNFDCVRSTVEFVVEFGWSLLVWGSTKPLQL